MSRTKFDSGNKLLRGLSQHPVAKWEMKKMWLKNLRDIIILPFTVTCVIPFFIYDRRTDFISDNILVKICGGILLALGLWLFAFTVFLFNHIGKGTLAPWSQKQKLVIQGPYGYCRNPMITSVLAILIGESLVFHSTAILKWAVIFFTINTLYFILVEEPGLYERFGENYLEYKKQVPRWIPRIKPYKLKN